jgi:hypothetical protein
MTVGFVGVHYPQPALVDDFVKRVNVVVEVLRSVPECLAADCWVTDDGGAVVSTARFASDDALKSAFAAAAGAGADFAFDERERQPRQVFKLNLR